MSKNVYLQLNLDGDKIKVCRQPQPSRPCIVSCRITTSALSKLMSLSTSIMLPYSSLASALLGRSIDLLYDSVTECPHQIALSIVENQDSTGKGSD